MLNHEPLRLADGEYRFACLVWDNEPLPSGQLVALAAEGLGWKKSKIGRASCRERVSSPV